MTSPVLIIAGDRREARSYSLSHGLNPEDWKWVNGVKTLLDNPDSGVVFTGNFAHRTDAKTLAETVKTQKMQWQHEPDLFVRQ